MAPIYCATMSIKSDRWIRRMAHQHRMIEPFADGPARAGVISYGVSAYRYGLPVGPAVKILTHSLSPAVRPARLHSDTFSAVNSDPSVPAPQLVALAAAG